MHLPGPVRRALRLGAPALFVVAALWAPAAAAASCVAPPADGAPWAATDAVFVGTVTSVVNRDRWATVAVEEVWQGPDQPAEVIVRGGPEGDAMTSVDRTYMVGRRYVFAVTVEDGTLLDNACSGTTEVGVIDLDAVRPAEVRGPGTGLAVTKAGPDLDGLVGPLAAVAVIGGLLLVTVLLARRREA